MNPIEEQRELIGQLYKLVNLSCHITSAEGYDTASCQFVYMIGVDHNSSIGTNLSFEKDGQIYQGELSSIQTTVYEVIPRLHAAMKAHTGGDWSEFTLTIGRDGQVKTKFHYPE